MAAKGKKEKAVITNRTLREWVKNPDGTQGYTRNPVKGYCPMACPYCYARRMYRRFKWDKTIRFIPEVLDEIETLKKPSTIFIGSTMELFGKWVKEEWLKQLFRFVRFHPEHTFIFLTKCPYNLRDRNPWPENSFVGVTVTNMTEASDAVVVLRRVEASIRFISFEPLLGSPCLMDNFKVAVEWVIIGLQTPYSSKTAPKLEWVQEIVERADRISIPVFLKNNLKPIWEGKLRQECPKVKQ